MMAQREFLPVAVQIVGTADNWSHVYDSPGIRYPQRQAAILAGIRHYEHDDFVLAILRGETLIGIAWQYEDRSREDFEDEAHEMADWFGWQVKYRAYAPATSPEATTGGGE